MTLADRIVVLNGGVIEQVGAPMELYERPRNLFVAEFIGSPKMNLIPGQIVTATAKGATVKTAQGDTLKIAVDAARATPGDTVTVGIRPEHLTTGAKTGAIRAAVTFAETLGHATFAYAAYGDTALTLQLPGDVRPKTGEDLILSVPADQAHLFDASGAAFDRL
jgi:ABC-type sugar transport system ATPase subunit